MIPPDAPLSIQLPTLPTKRVVRPTPVIPDHEVIRPIGSGAYGEVWLAKSQTDAWRAVKVVWREDFDDERSFNREFEGILQYEPIARNHPGLVHILHVGRHDGGSPFYYYVMELGDDARTGTHINPDTYLPRTLQSDKRFSGNQPLPLDYCLEVGSQLAHALAYLHSKNLTHRDIKPSNVIFVNGRPKLADIGLVAHSNQHTYVGTEGFIPPDGPGTERADVYALAKVLYEISTGKDRMEFPNLPDQLPIGANLKTWQEFNSIICKAAEPRQEACEIDSAELFAEHIDALINSEQPTLIRRRKKKTHTTNQLVPYMLFALGGALFATGILYFFYPPEQKASATSSNLSHTPSSEEKTRLLITTDIPNVSVYGSSGQYLDEVPFGPIDISPDTPVSYTLRKKGFVDHIVHIQPQSNQLCTVYAEMIPLSLPQPERSWQDAEGLVYLPFEGVHYSEQALTAKAFNQFLEDTNLFGRFPVLPPDNKLALLTNEEMSAYLVALNKKCRNKGLLDQEFAVSAIPIGESEQNGRRAYHLVVKKETLVPLSVSSRPEGADVIVNGQRLGKTPLEDELINQEAVSVELHLPGYETSQCYTSDPSTLSWEVDLKVRKEMETPQRRINSLGMEFIPLSDHLWAMSHEVRKKDFTLFCRETFRTLPPRPRFPQTDDHPIVYVTKKDAEDFARWLTNKERAFGKLGEDETYRLPTDEEWSCLVGINENPNLSPYERIIRNHTDRTPFPWGKEWPAPNRTGNFADTSALHDLPTSQVIPGYEDSYPNTSPVKSFPAQHLGIFDADGNVSEWVSDSFRGPDDLNKLGVVRGGNFLSFRPSQLIGSHRTPLPDSTRDATIGFRLVLDRHSNSPKIRLVDEPKTP